MRWSFCILVLLVLSLPGAFGQQQYTEGACILLQQQIDRFSHQKQNSNYRNAKSEYERFCRKPVSALQRQTTPTNNSAQTNATQPTKAENAADLANTTLPTKPDPDLVAVKPQPTPEPVKIPLPEPDQSKAVEVDDSASIALDKAPPEKVVVPVVVAQPEHLPMLDTITPDDIWMSVLTSIPLIAANLFALLLLVFLLTSWFGFNLPGFKGVFAEYKLNRLLRWRLSKRYQHFRKLKLLTAKNELVVVDHLVLSPFGIFVITVRGERGNIYGSETEANWRREYLGKTKLLMNPLHQNFKNTEAVRHLLQLKAYDASEQLHSVVAFSRVAQIKNAMPANITYVDEVSTYLGQFTQPCLNDEQVERYAALLTQASTDH
uniref:nuclease-related domain-containing protein n=1 Tax=Rheinheimera sp. TaxID=1869214 RepID=UPI004048D36F